MPAHERRYSRTTTIISIIPLYKRRTYFQAGRKFIILRARTGTILCVDQHAADERVKLENLERQVPFSLHSWAYSIPTSQPNALHIDAYRR